MTPKDDSSADARKVAARWSEKLDSSEDFSAKIYWLAIPEVMERHQRKAVGNRPYKSWVECCLGEFLSHRLPVERILSVGCGTGALERELAGLNTFRGCDAYDIAPGALEVAKAEAARAGYAHIHYHLRDINRVSLPQNYYDAVWFNGSLHHVEALERVYEQVAYTLKPDGYLFFNEYIGPSRFDFTPRQKEVMTAALALIPRRFRHCFVPDAPEFQDSAQIPDPKAVAAADPSEAVRSAEIMPLLRRYFDVLMVNEMGGTLLHFLLSGIAGNFRADDPDSMVVLRLLMSIEDMLLEVGDLRSDFAVVAAHPKAAAY